jgi:hypothetical protein
MKLVDGLELGIRFVNKPPRVFFESLREGNERKSKGQTISGTVRQLRGASAIENMSTTSIGIQS